MPHIVIDPQTREVLHIVRGNPMKTYKVANEKAYDEASRRGRNIAVVAHPYVPDWMKKGAKVSPLFMSPALGGHVEVTPQGRTVDANPCGKRMSGKNPAGDGGFYVMKWGAGRWTSVAWYGTKEEAEREVKRIKTAGAWSGMPPRIEKGRPSGGRMSRNGPNVHIRKGAQGYYAVYTGESWRSVRLSGKTRAGTPGKIYHGSEDVLRSKLIRAGYAIIPEGSSNPRRKRLRHPVRRRRARFVRRRRSGKRRIRRSRRSRR